MNRLAQTLIRSILPLAFAGAAAAGATNVSISVRDAAGAVVPEAVVSLEGADRGSISSPATVIVDQRDKQFVPQVTVIQPGTRVRFPNSDAVSHHVYSFARPNAFELPLYKGGSRPEIRFEHEGIVTLGCNIHDAMLGWIVVVDTPHFGVTDARGSVTFPDVIPGDYRVRVWSPRLDPNRLLDAGSVVAGADPVNVSAAVARRLRGAPVTGGSLATGDY